MSTNDKMVSLFDDGGIDKEWTGMPEFTQEKQRAFAQIVFRFECEADLQLFANLIGQKLTNKTKSAWFPFKSHFRTTKKEWTV